MPDDPHLAALARALVSEQRFEAREHARLEGLPLMARVAAGITWAPLEIEEVRPAGRGRTRVILSAPKPEVLHEGISSGDLVRLAPAGSPDAGVEGTCLGSDERHAEVRTEEAPEITGAVAVSLRVDPRTHRRYLQAVERADSRPSPLRDVLLGLRTPDPPLAHPPRHRAIERLNEAQREAATAALAAAQVALVHGPPGTGKTELVTALLHALAGERRPAWALADSNAAVDHLALRAARSGLEVVRVGHPARIGSAVTELTLDARLGAHPLAPVLGGLDRELSATWKDRSRRARDDRRRLLAERDRLEGQARRAVLDAADVLAVTLGTLARIVHELPRARVAVVDEATQAVEPAIWTVVPFVERLVLVGDPRQLGPVVKEPGNPLQRSLVERLLGGSSPDSGVEAAGAEPVAGRAASAGTPSAGELPMPMLRVQHRMHRDVQALVDAAYGGLLEPHPSVADHVLRDLEGVADSPLTSRPTLWVDTAGAGFTEERDELSQSLFNEGEIRLLQRAARELREAGVPADAIGVVAPYSAQVSRLRMVPELAGVEVATVNAYQGREKEAILVSWVRTNPEGELGFVADERRLTVALTRARRFLLCVGDSSTLSSLPRFGEVLQELQRQDGWASAWDEPWSEALD